MDVIWLEILSSFLVNLPFVFAIITEGPKRENSFVLYISRMCWQMVIEQTFCLTPINKSHSLPLIELLILPQIIIYKATQLNSKNMCCIYIISGQKCTYSFIYFTLLMSMFKVPVPTSPVPAKNQMELRLHSPVRQVRRNTE